MAKISYEMFQKSMNNESNGGGSNSNVRFFSLKNDGDEAIVRILVDSQEDYELITTHTVKQGDKWSKVECLNEAPRDNKCPLCSAGVKMTTRLFVPMIQYTKDEKGAIVATCVMWDRSAYEMSPKLNAMLQEYGPLSDCVFKVRRNGAAGNLKTTYEILFANPNVYRPDLYPKNTEDFNGFSASGVMVSKKTAEEMTHFLNTGAFPAKANSGEATASAPTYAPNTSSEVESKPMMTHTTYSAPTSDEGRPARYY